MGGLIDDEGSGGEYSCGRLLSVCNFTTCRLMVFCILRLVGRRGTFDYYDELSLESLFSLSYFWQLSWKRSDD